MARPEQPDKDTMCHRTGFTKSCFECVTTHGCRLWKRVTLTERHPETGALFDKDVYDCLDSQKEVFWKDMLRRQLQTTATVDNLRQEVREAGDQTLVGTLARLNDKIDQAAEPTLLPGSSPKLLEN
jgi:hypothetical protein